MATFKILVTTDLETEVEAKDVAESLTLHFGKAELLTEAQALEVSAPEGPKYDAYGNPYSQGGKQSPTHDAYGNPYVKGDGVATPTHDKYGNPYARGPKR